MADLKVGFNVEGVPRSEAIFLRAVNKMVAETKRMRTSFDQLNKSMKSSGRQVEDTAKKIKKSTKELGYMERALGNLRKAWDYSTKSIFNFKNAIIVVIAQMAATKLFTITKDIFNIGAEFEKMMVTVKMVSGATITEYQAMTDAARALGGSTEYTATQVADAMRFLAMAGLKANEVLGALPSTLNFATAANLTMAESADISTNIMTAMGLKVEDLVMVHDTLTTTIQSSNTTVKEIAESMKYSATTANLMGIDIQFLSAMLGKLGDSGIKGSMAGTALNNAFIKINKNMPEFANGTEGMIALLVKLKEQSWGLTKGLENFGVRGARPMLVLANSADDALEKLMDLYKGIQEGTNTTEDFADAIRETAWGSLRVFQSAVEDIKLEVFSNKSGEMTNALNIMTDAIKDNKDEIVDFAGNIVETLVNATPIIMDTIKSLGNLTTVFLEPVILLAKLLGKIQKVNTEIEKAQSQDFDRVANTLKGFGADLDVAKITSEFEKLNKFITSSFIGGGENIPLENNIFNYLIDNLESIYKNTSLDYIKNSIKETKEEIVELQGTKTGNLFEVGREVEFLKDKLKLLKEVGLQDFEGQQLVETIRPSKNAFQFLDDYAAAMSKLEISTDPTKNADALEILRMSLKGYADELPGATKAVDVYAKAMEQAEALAKKVVDNAVTGGWDITDVAIDQITDEIEDAFTKGVDDDFIARTEKKMNTFEESINGVAKSARELADVRVDTFFAPILYGIEQMRDLKTGKLSKDIQAFLELVEERKAKSKEAVSANFDTKESEKINKIIKKLDLYRNKYKVVYSEREKEINKINAKADKEMEKIRELTKDENILLAAEKEILAIREKSIKAFDNSYMTNIGVDFFNSLSDGVGSAINTGLTSGSAAGIDQFVSTLSNELSTAISSAVSFVVPGLGGNVLGSILGGVGGGIVNSMFGGSEKSKAEIAASNALIKSLKDLDDTLRANITSIDRMLSSSYQSSSISEDIFAERQSLKEFTDEQPKFGGSGPVSSLKSFKAMTKWFGTLDLQVENFAKQIELFYRTIKDEHKDFIEKYINVDKNAYQTAGEEFKSAASNLVQGMVDVMDAKLTDVTYRIKEIFDFDLYKTMNIDDEKFLDTFSQNQYGAEFESFGKKEGKNIYNEFKKSIANLSDIIGNDSISSFDKLKAVMDSNLMTIDELSEASGIATNVLTGLVKQIEKFAEIRLDIIKGAEKRVGDIINPKSDREIANETIRSDYKSMWDDIIDNSADGEGNGAEFAYLLSLMNKEIEATSELYDEFGNAIYDAIYSIGDMQDVFDSFRDFGKDRERKDWGVSNWQGEVNSIATEIGMLDENSLTYYNKFSSLLEDQLSAMDSLLSVAESQLSAYIDAQKSVEEQIWDLTGGSQSTDASLSEWDSKFNTLLTSATTKGAGGEYDIEAISAFQAFIPKWEDVMTAAGIDTATSIGTAVTALNSISDNLSIPITKLADLIEGVTTNITDANGKTNITIEIDGETIAYVIVDQLNTNDALRDAVKEVQ